MVSASLLYQFWLHTTLICRLGWVEGILNTPSAHRVTTPATALTLIATMAGC